MEPVALKRASELIQVTDLMERLGLSPERTLRQAKLPMWHYSDPEDPIPAHHINLLMDQAARSLGNPAFGVLVGADSSLATMGSFGRLIANSLTTYHAHETSCRLIRQHCSDAHHWLTHAGSEVRYCGKRGRGPETGRRQMEQYKSAGRDGLIQGKPQAGANDGAASSMTSSNDGPPSTVGSSDSPASPR